MGFSEIIYLVGVELKFACSSEPHTVVEMLRAFSVLAAGVFVFGEFAPVRGLGGTLKHKKI